MGTRVRKKIALSLEAETERRRNDRVAHDGHVVQRIVEAERKSSDQ